MRDTMDYIYKELPDYNSKSASGYEIKFPFIMDFVKKSGNTILDVGCGQGDNLKALMARDFDVFGIDFSSEVCRAKLHGLPHQCVDILTYCNSCNKMYDAVICSGVLEHLTKDEFDENLVSISRVSTRFLFGIANHPDIIKGRALHTIVEDSKWWMRKLTKYFDKSSLVTELYEGSFFFIECRKKIEGAKDETKSRVRKGKD